MRGLKALLRPEVRLTASKVSGEMIAGVGTATQSSFGRRRSFGFSPGEADGTVSWRYQYAVPAYVELCSIGLSVEVAHTARPHGLFTPSA